MVLSAEQMAIFCYRPWAGKRMHGGWQCWWCSGKVVSAYSLRPGPPSPLKRERELRSGKGGEGEPLG